MFSRSLVFALICGITATNNFASKFELNIKDVVLPKFTIQHSTNAEIEKLLNECKQIQSSYHKQMDLVKKDAIKFFTERRPGSKGTDLTYEELAWLLSDRSQRFYRATTPAHKSFAAGAALGLAATVLSDGKFNTNTTHVIGALGIATGDYCLKKYYSKYVVGEFIGNTIAPLVASLATSYILSKCKK